MKLQLANGMLIIVADSPKDGYELAEMQQQAVVHGKTLNIRITQDSVAAAVRLEDHAKKAA